MYALRYAVLAKQFKELRAEWTKLDRIDCRRACGKH